MESCFIYLRAVGDHVWRRMCEIEPQQARLHGSKFIGWSSVRLFLAMVSLNVFNRLAPDAQAAGKAVRQHNLCYCKDKSCGDRKTNHETLCEAKGVV